MDYKSGLCTFCGTGCGNFLKIRDGKISGVYSMKNHPVSRGRLCVRGWHIHELLMTDQRISSPMIRKNGVLEEAGYDEAIDFMLEKMSKYKGDAADSTGFLASPRSSNEDSYLFMKLARAVFKTNNITMDSESGHRSSLDVLHTGTGMPGMTGSLASIGKTDFILVVGADVTRMNPIVGSEIHKAEMAGVKVVTICSRSSQIAKLSSLHLQINPGSKKSVIAAIAKVIMEEKLYDAQWIKDNTSGLESFLESLKGVDLKEIESLSGMDYNKILSVARELCSSESAMAFWSTGIAGLDRETVSYIYNLFLLAGKVGKENCGVNPLTGITNLQGGYDMGAAPDLLTGFQRLDDPAVLKKFNDAWGTDFNPVPGKDIYGLLGDTSSGLKALVVADHDEGIIRYKKEIEQLEFVAYIGTYLNPFMELADVVIPVAGSIENDGTYTSTERRVQLSRKRVEAFNNVYPGWKLYSMIAEKASMNWDYSSSEDVFREIAALTPSYSGITYKKLEEFFGVKWPCNDRYPDGCETLDAPVNGGSYNFAPVSGNFSVPSASSEYPFLLITGQGQHFWHQNNIMQNTYIPRREYRATLLLYPNGYVEICKADADALKVRDKWTVKISSPHGSMNVDVKVSEDVKRGTAYIPYFIREMITEFLLEHKQDLQTGEDAIIPIRIEGV
jgi:formate dehydrogenase major subunit